VSGNLSLDGLVSGIPTRDIIDQLMEIERQPLLRLEEDRANLNTEKDVWRDVNTRIANLESKLTTLKLSATYNSNQASSSDENAVTVTATSEAHEGTYEISITRMARAHRVASAQQESSIEPLGYAGEGDTSGFEITVNDKTWTFSVSGDYSLDDVRDAINNTEEVGVTASIINNTLVLESADTGEANEMVLADTAGTLLQDLGVIDQSGVIQHELETGTDAELTINGIQVTSASNTVDDAVHGLTFTIHDEPDSGTLNVVVTVSRDIDKAASAIQEFVDQYNSTMDFIDSKLDYDSDTGNAGALQGDGTLMRIQMNIRHYITDRVDTTSDYDQLAMIGITIDRDGVMSFDRSTFEEAMTAAPDEVMQLFKAEKSEDGFNGVAVELDSYLDMLLRSNTGVIPKKVDMYDTMIDQIDDRVTDMERRLEMVQEKYLRQFSAMETALSEMQQQSNWLMAQIMSIGGVGLFSTLR